MNAELHSDAAHEPAGSSLVLDLREMLSVLRRRAFLIFFFTVMGTALGVGYIFMTPKMYAATTVLQVEQQQRAVVGVETDEREDLKAVDVLKTIENNLSGGSLLLRVAKATHFEQDADFVAGLDGSPPSDAALIRALRDRVQVALRRGTRLIDVTAEAREPVLAQQLSQALVDEYIRLDFDLKLDASKPSNQYLVQEAERLRTKLGKSEQALQAYKEEQRAVSLENSQNIVVEMLKDLNMKLGTARAERLKLEADAAEIDRLSGRPAELLAVASIVSSPEVQALKQRLTEHAAVMAGIAGRYKPQHPKVVQAQSEKTEIEASLHRAASSAAGQVKAAFASAKATEDKLVEALKTQEKEALELNKKSIQYNVLSRDVESDRALYEAVLTKLKETQVVEGAGQGSIRIVEPALLPDRPSKPKKAIVLALACFLGFVSGTGLSFGLAFFNAPLLTVAQAERVLALPSLGAIPRSRTWHGRDELMIISRPRSPVAEAFRSLRTTLSLRVKGDHAKSFLFTSAMPGEGKTFCSANLAAALAQEGLKTLLIDADLRKPGLSRYFFGKRPRPGLAELLAGHGTFEEHVETTGVGNLSVISAGAPTLKAPDLLASKAMLNVLHSALAQFDRVIVDSSPVLPVTDTLLLVEHVEAVCLVVRAGKTPAGAVRRAQHLLTTSAGRPPVGFVMDQISRGPDSYAAYGV